MGSGIDCATGSNTGCSVNIVVGATVTLTATPSNGALFAGWSASPTSCTVSGNMCTFQMPAEGEVVFATFNAAPGTPLLAVQILGTGSGSATGNGIACFSGDGTGCTIGIGAGTQVTLTESPVEGSTFAGWSAPCSNAATTCSFSMPGSGQFVTATFTATPTSTFTLTPNQLFFGPLALNSMSLPQTLTVSNTGETVTINGISFIGNAAGDFGQTSTCGTTLSGDDGQCSINVTATPTAAGPRTADLNLASSDPNSPAISHMTANGTIRQLPGFTANVFPANDDGSTSAIPLPFSVNFFGTTFSSLYVNNNGNVTFSQPFSEFTPSGLNGNNGGVPIIAPYWADVDTTGAGSSLVTYGIDTVNGQPAFGVDYENVGYFESNFDKLNSFQVILIDRPDTGVGNFDIEFDYDKIQWEAGDASGGADGLCGTVLPPECVPAAVGFSNGTGTAGTNFQLNGSFVPGALLDGGPAATSLIINSLNSGTLGRYVFQVRSGTVQTADLSLTMTNQPTPAVAGSNETFTLTVGNAGPSNATNVTVTDTMPTNAIPASITPSQGTCTGIGGTLASVSCNLGTVNNGAEATITIVVTVNANATGTVSNSATVTSDLPDPNPNNNSASVSVAIGTAANAPVLAISKSHTGNFIQGQQGDHYTVTVSNGVNAGPTSGTVTVTEAVPTGLTLASMAGTGWTCGTPTANVCTNSTVLNPGQSYQPITVTVNVATNAPAQVTNTVTVSGGGTTGQVSASDVTVITPLGPPMCVLVIESMGGPRGTWAISPSASKALSTPWSSRTPQTSVRPPARSTSPTRFPKASTSSR